MTSEPPINRSGAVNVFGNVLPLMNMLDPVPAVPLPDALRSLLVANPHLPDGVCRNAKPTADAVERLAQGALETAGASDLVGLLPPQHDGVDAVHYVASLVAYTLETPYRVYLAVTIPLNISGERSPAALGPVLPYLKLLTVAMRLVPRDSKYWYRGTVYRGINMATAAPDLQDKVESYEAAFVPGKTEVTFAAPTSASRKDDIASTFTCGLQYVLADVEGVSLPAGDLSHYTEDEVLLCAPSVFEVVTATKCGRTVFVMLTPVATTMSYLKVPNAIPVPPQTIAWVALGDSIGDRSTTTIVDGISFSQQQCYVKALEINVN